MDVGWGASADYPGRAHLVVLGDWFALCSIRWLWLPMRVSRRWLHRPAGLVLCPECALAFVHALFPEEPGELGAER